jgi:hypothetical protein
MELRLNDDRHGRLAHVGDVHVRHEPRLADERRAPEDVAEELVDFAAHALEVGEEILLRRHPP